MEFYVECTPPTTTAQQRGRRKHDPARVKLTKAFWRAVARMHKPAVPLKGTIRADIAVTWLFTQEQMKEGLTRSVLKDTKPDCDNIEKALWDAFEEEGYFSRHDGQIALKLTSKWNGPVPGVHVKIFEVDRFTGEPRESK